MCNKDIREYANKRNVRLWQIAIKALKAVKKFSYTYSHKIVSVESVDLRESKVLKNREEGRKLRA